MASYHVLYATGSGTKYGLSVEYHLPVPSEVIPLTGANLQTLLANDSDYEKTSNVATGQELTDLVAGALIKITERLNTNSNKSDAAIRAEVRSRYDLLAVEAINTLRKKYKATGFEESKGADF